MDLKTFPFVMAPLEHQREEFVEHRDTFKRGLLWDPGTGKSKAAIDKMAYLFLAIMITVSILPVKNR